MPERLRRQVREFAGQLRLAQYDRRLEDNGERQRFYFDADVVLRLIMGFELKAPTDQQANLVRSLLGCYRLGTMHILQVHGSEVSAHLERTFEARSYKERADHYVRKHGLGDTLEQLRRIIDGPADADRKAEAFFKVLRTVGVNTFIALERISGHWTQRLRRYYGSLLTFENHGPDMGEILAREEGVVRDAYRELNQLRPEARQANVHDAAALGTLAEMVQQRLRRESDAPIVRFYTETPAFHAVLGKNSELKQAVSLKVAELDSVPIPSPNTTIIRNAAYFIMRARFPELRFGDRVEVDEVNGLLDDLSRAERLDDNELARALRSIKVAGKDLMSIIDEFQELSLMGSLWVREEMPDALRKSFEEWADVFAYAHSADTQPRFFSQVADIRVKLESELSRIVDWTTDYETLAEGASVARQRIRGSVKEPMRDLGLIRWGYEIDDEMGGFLKRAISSLVRGDDDDLALTCMELATTMEKARHDERMCLTMSAILWSLGSLAAIGQLIADFEREQPRVSPPLAALRAAAAIRSGEAGSPQARQRLIDEVSSRQVEVPESRRGMYLLGVGYVLYQAFRKESSGRFLFRQDSDVSEHAREWAQDAFGVGEQAVKLLRSTATTETLAWAFAVNHCLYVGTTTGVALENLEDYAQELLALKDDVRVWTARFDDSLGTYYLALAERKLDHLRADAPDGNRVRVELNRASEYLEKARARDVGDIDVDLHISRVQAAQTRLRRILGSADTHT